ncbi:DNA binding domain-containing protein, excisionase family [[Clostridium] aminophilum]|uniref:DNA binding domain-containing protein, excisionase family n=2 Tax=[Clostridium] aminophilum TaxID=1526 RepID=A0A1I6ISE2_9FIRM|nr:excisionase [[Clostridium] aminophilum]SFR69665.1 DNA binding domain-containing protein, excisionase family [[Clostridium] aminophilum]
MMTLISDRDAQKEPERVPIYEKVTLTIREAAEYSNIGINRLENMLRMPRCPFVLYVGKKKLVKRKEFEKFLSETIQL